MFEIIVICVKLAYLALLILPFYIVYTMFAEGWFILDALVWAFIMLATWFAIFAIRVKKLPQAELGIVEAMMESFLRFVFKRPTDAEKRHLEREEKRAEINRISASGDDKESKLTETLDKEKQEAPLKLPEIPDEPHLRFRKYQLAKSKEYEFMRQHHPDMSPDQMRGFMEFQSVPRIFKNYNFKYYS